MRLRFALLDSVRAWRDGVELDLGSPQARGMLALLLLHDGRPVTTDELADGMWGEEVPRAARGTLRTYVHRLRRVLSGEDDDLVIKSTGDGYVLPVAAENVDLRRFRLLVQAARIAGEGDQHVDAVDRLWEALNLWRGVPLAGIRGSFVEEWRAQLNRLRISTLEELLELELSLGRHGEVIEGALTALAAEPFRERLRGLLMVALYRSGRQAEALAAYQDARVVLREELGTEPASELQELHQRILRSDPDLLATSQEQSSSSGKPLLVPAQLPADLPVFVGRRQELAAAMGLTPGGDAPATDVLVAVVSGTAGVGKTAFAVHWAHQIAHRFPDGQLYVNLRGFDGSDTVLTPEDALQSFLEALGVPARRIPADVDAQSALYRSLVAGRQCLIVIDNARDAEQVRPLLPGSSGCLVIVTSRHRLSGLVASTGAHTVGLDLLSAQEATEFLTRRLGSVRVDAELDAVRDINELCARLPLALAVAAARAASNPHFPLAAVAEELAVAHASLDAFAGSDTTMDLRAVFSWSYRTLSADAARVFRFLSLHPGTDLTVPATASLIADSLRATRTLLKELSEAQLLVEHAVGRYVCHDLLRTYAHEVLDEAEPQSEVQSAGQRLIDYYVYSADAAFRIRAAYPDLMPLPALPPGVTPEVFEGYSQAMDWVTTEYATMLTIVADTVVHKLHVSTMRLARALSHFQEAQGRWHDFAASQRAALDAAHHTSDPEAIAHTRTGNARAAALLERHHEAHRHFDEAIAIFESVGDSAALAFVEGHRAKIFVALGDFLSALHPMKRALTFCRSAGRPRGEADLLNGMAWCYTNTGEHAKAIDYCHKALDIYSEFDAQPGSTGGPGRAATLGTLAHAQLGLGDYSDAIDNYWQAIEICRKLGLRTREGDALVELSEAYQAAGDPETTRKVLEEALVIMTEYGLPIAGRIRVKLLGLGSAEVDRYAVRLDDDGTTDQSCLTDRY